MRERAALCLLLLAACGPHPQADDPDASHDASALAPDAGAAADATTTVDARAMGPDGRAATPDAGAAPDAAPPACTPRPTCAVHFELPAAGLTSAELRGDFAAGAWQSGVALTRSGANFSADVTLADGQTITYKYFVDGGRWISDPTQPARLSDGYQGWNSLRSVSCGCAQAEARDQVLYFVLLDRFRDGDPTNNRSVAGVEPAANYHGGDLAGVRQKIADGYFRQLGATALWLSSPFDNAQGSGMGDDGHLYSAYHGYWPRDPGQVDPRAGTRAEATGLIGDAHAAGMRVVLDYVMNHVHEESPVYRSHSDWFWPLGNCVCGQGCSWDSEPDRLRCWFRSYLPDFDFGNAAARGWSVANAINWASSLGIDGYRLDAVKHIDPAWLTDLRRGLARPIYLVGETFSNDQGLIRSYIDPATKLDGQFDFPLRAELVRTVLMRQGRMADLAAFLDSDQNAYGPGAVMGTFLGNHDLPRAIHLAEDNPQFGNWDSGKPRAWQNRPQAPGGDAPYQRLGVGFALLFTLPGVPLIYYGDEIGMPGGGDPDNRRDMQWSGLSPAQSALQDTVASLANLRNAHPALRRGTRHPLAASDNVMTFARAGGGEVLYVAVNRGDAAASADGLPPGTYSDLISGADVTTPVALPPRSARVLAAKGVTP